MTTIRINSLCGLALILAGVSVALWSLSHPWAVLGGADIGRSNQWMLSHTFHFLGGLFGLVGLLGFVDREINAAGLFERLGYVLAFVGTILFTATGVFTAFLWPVLAAEAPALTELNGPFLSPPHPVTLITRLLYSLGYILLAISLMRTHVIARWGGTSLVLGALLLLVPTTPLSSIPWVVFPVAGVLSGLGMVALGLAARNGFAAAISHEPRGRKIP